MHILAVMGSCAVYEIEFLSLQIPALYQGNGSFLDRWFSLFNDYMGRGRFGRLWSWRFLGHWTPPGHCAGFMISILCTSARTSVAR